MKIKRNQNSLREELESNVEGLINQTLDPEISPRFSYASKHGMPIYRHLDANWQLVRKRKIKRSFFGWIMGEKKDSIENVAFMSSPVSLNGEYNPISIRVCNPKSLNEIEKLANAYKSLSGKEVELIKDY